MTSRELIEARGQLKGPLWQLVLERLNTRYDIVMAAAAMVPTSPADIIDREKMLARGVIYQELFDEIPGLVESKLKEAQESELKNS